jgi:hypothetical protein
VGSKSSFIDEHPHWQRRLKQVQASETGEMHYADTSIALRLAYRDNFAIAPKTAADR